LKVCEQSQRHSISTRKDWSVHKLSHAFGLIGSGTTPASSEESFYGGEVPWLNTGDLTDGEVIEIPKTVTEEAVQRFSALKVYPAESLVIALYGATIGKLGILNRPASVNQACCVLAEPRTLDSKFTFYWLWSSRQQIIELAKGGGQPNISQETVRQLRVEAPPLPTQKAIANFLDRKTAAIDALIEKKEKLLALLAEKRSALINQAVTKGLNPNVPMKDSGIPWIGEIPEHWVRKRLKYYFGFEKGRNAQELTATYIAENPGAYPVYSGQTENEGVMGRIHSFAYDLKEAIFTTTVGAKVMTSRVVRGQFSLSQNCLVMIPRVIIDVPFVNYQLETIFRHERAGIPSHMQPSLRVDDLRKYDLLVPPESEQRAISKYLREAEEKRVQIVRAISEQVIALKEYRQSLITAAVTGQLEIPAEDYEATPTEDRPS